MSSGVDRSITRRIKVALRSLLEFLPTREQWDGWALPSKLTAIGAYVGVAALALALIAPLASLALRLLEEELYVEVGPFEDQIPVEMGRGYGNHSPPPVTFAFPVKLVNESSRNISIVDYEVKQLNCDYINAFDDTEAVRGFFADAAGSHRVRVPISLLAGSGMTIYARFGITTDFLPEEVNPNGLTLRQLRLLAARESSADLLGNQVNLSIGARGWADIEILDTGMVSQPLFEITFRTSRGSRIRALLAPYPDVVRRQGFNKCEVEPLSRQSPLMIDEIEESS